MTLPTPTKPRWKPLRGGLLNLYLFDRIELLYEDGRLLLRGNNGTGKSRILALQLPFLLDGEITPSRVEPDGDPSKRIEWHLLMGGRHQDRTGYTWLEFGRLDEHGVPQYRTIGCGMKAVQGKGAPSRWLFVTERRVGRDLDLANPSGVPLGRRKLEEALGELGTVYDDAAGYRAALDHTFFGLGPHRYAALIELLIQLRRPQLARKLETEMLSSALTEALPPPSESVLGDVAEAFRGLEVDRDALEGQRAALGATGKFLETYRRYVQLAARRRADAVRQEHGAYETAQRRRREAEAELAEAGVALTSITADLARIEQEQAANAAALEALQSDPAHRDASRLEEAKQARARAAEEACRVRTDRDERRTEVERRAQDERDGEALVAKSWHEANEAGSEARALLAELGIEGAAEASERALLTDAVAKRRREAEHLRSEIAEVEATRQSHLGTIRERERAGSALENARAREESCRATRDAVRDGAIAALEAWAESTTVLRLTDLDVLVEALGLFAETGHGRGPIREAVDQAYDRVVRALASERAGIEARTKERRVELAAAQDEQGRLVRGEHLPPSTPSWRDASARLDRPGAPLWALCDFRAHVEPTARAGLEAALEGSGLLDAWVMPDGSVLADGIADLSLRATSPIDPARSLASWLLPAIDHEHARAGQVADEVVVQILGGIGAEPGAGAVWVSADGRFEMGPLRGFASKARPEHVGQGARELARRARLAELERRLAELTAALEVLVTQSAEVARREAIASEERARAPREDDLQGALLALVASSQAVREQRDALVAAEREEALARQRLDEQRAQLIRTAEDLRFTAFVDRLEVLFERLREVEDALNQRWRLLASFERERTRHERDIEQLERLRATFLQQEERLVESDQRAAAARALHEMLHATLKDTIEELQRRLAAAHDRRGELVREKKAYEADKDRESKRSARAQALYERHSEEVERADAGRRRASSDLQGLARTRLLGVLSEDWRTLDVSADWSPTAAIEHARRLDRELAEVEYADDAWNRVSTQVQHRFVDLSTALVARGLAPVLETEADVSLVTIPYEGRSLTPDVLHGTIADDLADRERILDAREREILENHLVGVVALHLQERIREAEDNVLDMNREIESRPLSTGMSLRFKWEVRDGDPEVDAARKRLRSVQGVWSPEDRIAVGEFLKRRIEAERSEAQTGTWREHLSRALDYRRWHEFVIERRQDARWVPLTRRTYGTGSGGEKAVALTLPLLAAAAAHYKSASPEAPRLILMDEAFVGVDTDMRAKCMGLLTAFDLDFVMTSEREWGCYSTVPALAIYQLVTRPGLDAVHETRWVWNGEARVRVRATDGDGAKALS